MAKRQAGRELRKVAKTKARRPAKKALPAFGLAEEIAGSRSTEVGTQVDTVDSPSVAERELHLVTFNLDREEYGVDIGSVQEIIRVGQITPVPNAPKFIRGVNPNIAYKLNDNVSVAAGVAFIHLRTTLEKLLTTGN